MKKANARTPGLKTLRHRLSAGDPTDKKHHLISGDLRQRIQAGEFVDVIPGQRVLADRYGVNFLTIRKAVATLVKEGLLVRQPGRGTFITRLKRERTRTFAAVLGGLSYGLGGQYAALIHGLQEETARHHHDLLLRPHDVNPEAEERVIAELLRSEKVDGVVLWPSQSAGRSAAIRLLRAANMPFVVVMRIDAEHRDQVSYVIDDDYRGGYAATKHLLDLGHRQIGYVARSPEGSGELFEEERWRGFRQAHADAGLAPGPRLQADWLAGAAANAETVPLKFIEALHRLTGVFCMNDRLALALLNLQKALRFQVPGELSVVGYDDMEAADLLGLTTMHYPMREIGAEAVRVLIGEVETARREPQAKILEAHLVVRATSAPPARRQAAAGLPP